MQTLKALALLAVLGAVVVPVAAGADLSVRATIPFEFIVGDSVLPAGTYQFEPQNYGHLLAIWNADQRWRTLVMVQPAYRAERGSAAASVVFNRYGARYFLSEVWGVPDAGGKRVLKSRAEREASLKASAQTVLVAAR